MKPVVPPDTAGPTVTGGVLTSSSDDEGPGDEEARGVNDDDDDDPTDPGHEDGEGAGVEMDPREEAEQILRYLEALRVQMRGMEEQGEYTRIGLEDNARARSTLESMGEVPEGQETLVPVGAGTFIRASKGSMDRVMVSLGRGVVAEVPLEKARDILEGRNRLLEAQYERVLQNVESLKQQAVSLQNRLEQLTTAVEPPNVAPLGQ